jgi:hypothetical protein
MVVFQTHLTLEMIEKLPCSCMLVRVPYAISLSGYGFPMYLHYKLAIDYQLFYIDI